MPQDAPHDRGVVLNEVVYVYLDAVGIGVSRIEDAGHAQVLEVLQTALRKWGRTGQDGGREENRGEEKRREEKGLAENRREEKRREEKGLAEKELRGWFDLKYERLQRSKDQSLLLFQNNAFE